MKDGLSNFHKNEIKHFNWKKNIQKSHKAKNKNDIKQAKNKEWETKLKKGNINTSLCEKQLKQWFIDNKIDFYHNFNKDNRYPWHVDFYLPKYDLFIEIQGHWTHGLHPFNKNNPNDINKYNNWLEKSIESNFYKSAINVWTKTDVIKRNTAKQNNLNYIEIFSTNIKQIIECISNFLHH